MKQKYKTGYVNVTMQLLAQVTLDQNDTVISAEWLDSIKEIESHVEQEAAKATLDQIEIQDTYEMDEES